MKLDPDTKALYASIEAEWGDALPALDPATARIAARALLRFAGAPMPKGIRTTITTGNRWNWPRHG